MVGGGEENLNRCLGFYQRSVTYDGGVGESHEGGMSYYRDIEYYRILPTIMAHPEGLL